jgi:hypothetical protein
MACYLIKFRDNVTILPLRDKTVTVFNYASWHEYVWTSEGIAPHIRNIGASWRSVFIFTQWPVYFQGQRPRYSPDGRLGWPQNRSGHGREERNYEIDRNSGLKPMLLSKMLQQFSAYYSTVNLGNKNVPCTICDVFSIGLFTEHISPPPQNWR